MLVGMGGAVSAQRTTLLRVALLVAVLFGLFGMHVLTAGHGDAGHGALPVPSAPAHGSAHQLPTGRDPSMAGPEMGTTSGDDQSRPATVSVTVGGGADHDAVGLVACVLFLTAGVALVALALIGIGRRPGTVTGLSAVLTWLVRRGPPERPPQSRLCVMRV